MKNDLVIGGLGFIGDALAKKLMKLGKNVFVTTQIHSINEEIQAIKINYDFDSFKKLLSEYDFANVYFFSGNSYPKFSENNYILDFNLTNIPFFGLLEAMRELNFKGNCWFASSVAVYGSNNNKSLKESDVCLPLSNYGISKLTAEEYVKFFARVHGINCGVFRIFSTYGSRLKRQIIYDVYSKLKKNPDKLQLMGTGLEARDLSHVDDQADKMILVAEKLKPKGDIVNIGSGNLYTVKELVSYITNILKVNPKIEYTEPIRSFDSASWKADIKILKEIGYQNEMSLYEGLKKTIIGYNRSY